MKRILMTVAAACLAASAMAQVQIGPKVGMNMYKISYGEDLDEEAKESSVIGFNVGVATSFGISENFSIAPELIFAQKGSRVKYEGSTITFDGTTSVDIDYKEDYMTKLNYLEMPVLARFAFGSSTKGYLNLGPSVGYWLGGKSKYTLEAGDESEEGTAKIKFVSEYSEDSEDDEYLKEEAKRLEVGGIVGGGMMLPTSAGNILLDIRYQAGFTSLFDFDEEDEKFKNNGLSVSLIYLFGSK